MSSSQPPRAKSVDLSRVDAEALLQALGVENIRRAKVDELNFSCPWPGHEHGDENPSAYMNTGEDDPGKSTLYHCFGCGAKGNAITFLARHEGVTETRAARWLREEFDADFREPIGGTFAAEWDDHFAEVKERQAEDHPVTLDESIQSEMFSVDWRAAEEDGRKTGDPVMTYMFRRGFDVDTLDRWDLGYDEISERITVPARDSDGSLVGFKARSVDPDVKPKYKVIGGSRYPFDRYKPHLILFGLDKLGQRDQLVVVEGELDAVALQRMNLPGVALGGSFFSKRQEQLLRWHADSVVLFLDSNKAGYAATVEIMSRLEPYMSVRVADDHEGDPASMEVEEAQELVRTAESSLTVTLPW